MGGKFRNSSATRASSPAAPPLRRIAFASSGLQTYYRFCAKFAHGRHGFGVGVGFGTERAGGVLVSGHWHGVVRHVLTAVEFLK